ncbi:MAG: response regulator [Gallionella sp.]|nr:response regulator [Gallionella sp.]
MPNSPQQPTILVVDDDEINRRLLLSLLDAAGYAVRTASGGQEALTAVSGQQPDLILLDVRMPDMDGFEVTRRLKSNARSASIPIVLLTALEDHESRLKGLEAGAEEFLTRPVDRAELQVRIKNLLKIKEYNNFIVNHNRILEAQVRERTSALKISEAKFHTITESAQDAIVMLDREGNISFWNGAAETIFSYSKREALGMNLQQLVPARLQDAYRKKFANFQQSGTGAAVGKIRELVAMNRDGNEFPVELSLNAVEISSQWHAIGIVRNISARKQIEDRLHRMNLLYNALSMCNKAIVRSNSPTELFEKVSRSTVQSGGFAMAWFGTTDPHTRTLRPVASFGEGAKDYLHDLEVSIDSNHELTPAGSFSSIDQPLWCQDIAAASVLTPLYERAITAGWRSFAWLPLNCEGAVTGALLPYSFAANAFDQDTRNLLIEMTEDLSYALDNFAHIAQRKRSEEQAEAQLAHTVTINARLLEANKQLEQSKAQLLQSEKMAAIGLLAAGVAHEINNPIGYINSNLGTLEKYMNHFFVIMEKYEAIETENEDARPLFQELHQFKAKINLERVRNDTRLLIAESQQGLERVKKIIIDLKEFSHSDRQDQWTSVNVHHVLDSTLNVVGNELKYKCEVAREYGCIPDICCLPTQLNQVFMNLLINAAQAIEVRGKITLSTGQKDGMIWVEVNDTGNGIPAENIANLFDPFFTTKPVGQGTGLGLSVSYQIVEKHHGKIEVHSKQGHGAAFRVWLPVKQPDLQERRHEPRTIAGTFG